MPLIGCAHLTPLTSAGSLGTEEVEHQPLCRLLRQKKSLAAGARVQKSTALPPPPPFLLPIHSCRYNTYSASYSTYHRFVRPPSIHIPLPERPHTEGTCQQGIQTDRHTSSPVAPSASALVVGTHCPAHLSNFQWTVGRRLTSSCRVGTVGLSKNQLLKWV